MRSGFLRPFHQPLQSAVVSLTNLTLSTSQTRVVPNVMTVAVPDGTTHAFIAADGDLFLLAGASQSAIVDLRLLVDGVAVRTLRTSVVNLGMGNMSSAWHLHALVAVTPGSHTISVDARVIALTTGQVQANSVPGRLSALLFAQ